MNTIESFIIVVVGLIDDMSNNIEEEKDLQSLSFDDMEPVAKENVTTQPMQAVDNDFDLF